MPRGGSRGPTLLSLDALAHRTPFAREMTSRRIAKGWSQYDLAKASGVPQSSIATYEVGVIRPGPNSLRKIKAALGWAD
jgi:predicted transcriptional regulator